MLPACRIGGEGFAIPTFDLVPSDVEGFMEEVWEFQAIFHDCFARSEPRAHFFDYIPTVSLDIISLVASSCGHYRGHIEHRAAHEFAVHVATQRERVECPQHRHPPRPQPVAPL